MPAPPTPAPATRPLRDARDDDLGELPPLDGDVRDAPQPEVEDDDAPREEGEASLDDSTGENATSDEELDLDESDGGWLDEPADAAGLDLGDTGIDLGAERASEDVDDGKEESSVAHEDLGVSGASASPERVGLDAGDEGPIDPDEELRDEDLPSLDADEAGDVDESLLIDPSFAEGEPHGLAWAAAPWDRVGAPLPIARAIAVACAGRGAVVVGRGEGGDRSELWRVDLEGACQTLPARGLDVASVRGLEGLGLSLSARVDSGATFVSIDGGVTFREQAAAGAPPVSRFPPARTARGAHVAQPAALGGVLRDDVAHAWGGRVTALAFLDDAGRLLAAMYSDADDTTALVHLDASGKASVVARLGATRSDADSDGQVLSMAHDEARGVVWLTGGFGVAAFAVR